LRTTSAYHLSPNAIQIEIKPTFSPKPVPPPICKRTHNEDTERQFAYPLPGPHSVPLDIGGNRHGHANATFLFSFFSSVSRHRVLSCRPRRTPPLQVKGGGSKGDTPYTLQCHIGVYCTGHKTHRDKLPTSHLLLMAGHVLAITHIRMQVVWARRDHLT